MELLFPYICLAAASFATTFVLVPAAKRLAIKLDAVDYPSKRRINTRPIPRMGGIAIFFGVVVAFFLQIIGTWYWNWPSALVPHPSMSINYPLLAVSFVLITAVGAIDDVVSLSPRVKLAGQVVAATVAAAGGLVIGDIVNPFVPGANIDLGVLAYPITVFYLVAFANIINLIDGLDGLATGISAIAALAMFSFAFLAGRVDAASLAISLFGGCLAFLRYNFHPASIFLGDAGALMLGFGLGMVSLLSVSRVAALTTLVIPLIVAGVPIIDTFAAIVRRFRAHVSIGQADKGHIQHRLIDEGFDQRQAVLLIYAWCLLLALGAVTINQVAVELRVVVFVILAACSAAFAMRLHLFEPVLRHHYNPKTHQDELVSPDNPAFEEEAAAAKRERAERREVRREEIQRIQDQLFDHAPESNPREDPRDQGTHQHTPDSHEKEDTHA